MSLGTKGLIEKISPYMSACEFKRLKNCFYFVANNLAFCVEFEKPSGLFYLHYYIIPLYIPHKNRCFTYGNRIAVSCTDNTECVEQIKNCLQNSIFSMFETISTPYKLVDALLNYEENLFFCTDIDILRLQFFTYAFINDQKKCIFIEKKYRRILLDSEYLHDTIKQKYLDEINVIRLMANKGANELLKWFQETILNTLTTSFSTGDG